MENSKYGRVPQCFNILECYRGSLKDGAPPSNGGLCRGIITKKSTLQTQCKFCKWMNKETQGYIEAQVCCACTHFHWRMGEMGTCDLREYKSFNDIGEWSDSCIIGKFEFKSE